LKQDLSGQRRFISETHNLVLAREKGLLPVWIKYLREILENDSSWFEWDISVDLGVFDPVKNLLDIRGEHVELVAVSHGRLQENSHWIWECLCSKTDYELNITYQVLSPRVMGACKKHWHPFGFWLYQMDWP